MNKSFDSLFRCTVTLVRSFANWAIALTLYALSPLTASSTGLFALRNSLSSTF